MSDDKPMPDFSFLLPRHKGSPVTNPNKDRSLRGKRRRDARKEARRNNDGPAEEIQDESTGDDGSA